MYQSHSFWNLPLREKADIWCSCSIALSPAFLIFFIAVFYPPLFHISHTVFHFSPSPYDFLETVCCVACNAWFTSHVSIYFLFVMQTNTLLCCLVMKVTLFKPPLYVLSFISKAHYLDKVVKGMAFLLPSIFPSCCNSTSINRSFIHTMFMPYMDILQKKILISPNPHSKGPHLPSTFFPFCHTVIST